ncbi:hypothetical protein HPP92_025960 [Vanilla planifolia]|uniref:Uncharacterized protein n=1 Tax=Vanilla planifolia TaxID=51239 RepID=A0A835PHR6_VANPL|nr:hypothetical protein HPP92_026230 [Vanilla planifolia]KAG0451949.1 hypothetical protein HPP92_025960 [Vanilla planifolia]
MVATAIGSTQGIFLGHKKKRRENKLKVSIIAKSLLQNPIAAAAVTAHQPMGDDSSYQRPKSIPMVALTIESTSPAAAFVCCSHHLPSTTTVTMRARGCCGTKSRENLDSSCVKTPFNPLQNASLDLVAPPPSGIPPPKAMQWEMMTGSRSMVTPSRYSPTVAFAGCNCYLLSEQYLHSPPTKWAVSLNLKGKRMDPRAVGARKMGFVFYFRKL